MTENKTSSVAIITENFIDTWRPGDSFLAGCQECTVYLADALKQHGYTVEVFLHGPTQCKTELYHGVSYRDFSCWDQIYPSQLPDNIILFKINPLRNDPRLQKSNIIFWSSDVQSTVSGNAIDHYVCLTDYHLTRNGWSGDNCHVFPHGVDTNSLDRNKTEKSDDLCLYTSSPDRGLGSLIEQWGNIKKRFPNLKLKITYGFKISKQISDMYGKLIITSTEEKIKQLCRFLDDVEYLGDVDKDEFERLLWKSKYWFLPLNNPDSELFCLSARKALYCESTPVIVRQGALLESTNKWVDFSDFCQGKNEVRTEEIDVEISSWVDIVEKYWKKILV